MIKLREIRLINWHGYQEEIVQIDGSTLITGENGVGKTTLTDAVQYALVANQIEVRFNKANENSRRTLTGYARWKVNSEEEGKSGSGRYLRPACTSYVMLGFVDEERPEADFVCGVVIETTDGDSIRDQKHFVAPRAKVQDIPAVNGERTPYSIREFTSQLKFRTGWDTIPDATTYQDVLRHRLGHLPKSFQRLLVKALDFKPIGSLRPFVMDFLLEERPIETDALIRNVENYQRLSAEAQVAERRIADLRQIQGAHRELVQAKEELLIMELMVLLSRLDAKQEEARALDEELEADEIRLKNAEAAALDAQADEKRFDEARDQVMQRLSGSQPALQRDKLTGDLNRAEDARREAQAARDEVRTIHGQMKIGLEQLTGPLAYQARQAFPEWFVGDPFADPRTVEKCRAFLTETSDRDGTPDGRRARTWASALEDANNVYGVATAQAENARRENTERIRSLNQERDDLERGLIRYDNEPAALIHLLNRRLNTEGEIRPLCELIEVADPEWRDAAEGMLGRDRFALLVPPQHYRRAKQLYREHRDGYALPGRGVVPLHSAKLIDVEGVLRDVRSGRGAREGSLAEKIETENSMARAYVDFTLGNVICERDLDRIQHHARAVTPEVMVHQGHATFRMNPRSFERQYIGRASQSRRMEQIASELVRLHAENDRIAPVLTFARGARDGMLALYRQHDHYLERADQAGRVDALKEQANEIRRQIQLLDRDPEVQELNAEKLRWEEKRNAARNRVSQEKSKADAISLRIKAAKQRLPLVQEDHAALRQQMQESFETPELKEWSAEQGMRYAERRKEQTAQEIESSYLSQQKNRETRVNNRTLELREHQVRFENEFKLSAPKDPTDIELYEQDLAKWVESELPSYQEKIEGVRQDARKALAEDYLLQLFDSFQVLDERFKDMRDAFRATKDVIGWGRYSFEKNLNSRYAGLYNLVLDVGTVGVGSLWDDPDQHAEAREEIDKLADRLLQYSPDKASELVIKDYREFFDYDLVLYRNDGKKESFANVSGAGSGGENQVPYYVAIFSAMYHLYRSRSKEPTFGLVLLDEAFSKMDEQRIESVMELARYMQLQLLLVTPGDKVATIVPRVDTTLLIQREQGQSESIPVIHRFHKEIVSDVLSSIQTEALAAANAS
jgi:uncharacterized protein YPO0396